jgi:hypothetical protein
MFPFNPKYIFYIFAFGIASAVFYHFYDLESFSKSNKVVVDAQKVVADEKKKDEVATNKLETKYETITKTEIQYVDREVTKQVIVYKDRVVNRCRLDPEWVRIYNLSTDQAGAEGSPSILNGSASAIGKIADR